MPLSVPSASRQPDVRPSPATTKRFRSFDDVGDDLSDWRCDDDDFKLYLSDDDSDEENEKSVEEFVDIQIDTNNESVCNKSPAEIRKLLLSEIVEEEGEGRDKETIYIYIFLGMNDIHLEC